MSLTITRVITGDVDDLASVTLLSLVRTDTGAAVTFPVGGAFTEGTDNDWSISFTAPAPALTYAYTYRRTFSDGSNLDGAGTLVDASTEYVGRYTSEHAVEQFIGTLNLNSYGSVEGGLERDAGAVTQAIVSAEARVDYYRNGPYDITDPTKVGARLLELWSRKLASVEVARKRLGKSVEDLDTLEAAVIVEMEKGLDLPGVTEDNTDTSALDKLNGLAPARGKINCERVHPGCFVPVGFI